jgi:hypothetical protein
MAAARLTKAFLRKRMAQIARHASLSEAARTLRVPYATLQHQIRSALACGLEDPFAGRPRHPGGPAPARPPTDEEWREIIRLRTENARLAAALKEADHRAIEADRFRKLSAELHEAMPEVPSWPVKMPSGADSPGVPVLFLSDWHIGETVDPAQVH